MQYSLEIKARVLQHAQAQEVVHLRHVTTLIIPEVICLKLPTQSQICGTPSSHPQVSEVGTCAVWYPLQRAV